MFPPYIQTNLQLSNRAGMLQTSSLPPGIQGAEMTGTQGIGVNTPQAAAVAEATVGLAID